MGQLIKDVGGKALWGLERMISKASLVDNAPFLDPATFDWISTLESSWQSIRKELDEVLTEPESIPRFQDISKDQVSITTDEKWKTFFFYGMGYKAHSNCARCPETTRLIDQVPGMKTAFFSILAPGKHIPEHRGLFKGLLRYHLGLRIPEPQDGCGIRVAGETRRWVEGKSLLFDDTYPHEAWNDTDSVRVVLFLDIVRPLRFPVSVINESIIRIVRLTPYVQDSKKNFEQWDTKAEMETDTEPIG